MTAIPSRSAVWIRRLVLLVAGGYVTAGMLEALWWPMGFDQGVFAWAGDVILRGGMPYRDAWEIKGPATFYTYALSQWLFGRNFWGIRLLDLIAVTAACLALWRLQRRPAGAFGAGFGVLLFVAMYAVHGFWMTAQPDGWGGMLVLGALALVRAPGGRPQTLAAGALVGLACLYKATFAVFLLPVALLVTTADRPLREMRLTRPGLLVAAFLAPPAAAAGWLVSGGAWPAFFDIQFGFNLAVHGPLQRRPFIEHYLMLVLSLLHPFVLPALALAALGVWRGWRIDRRLALALGLAALLALALVAAQDKYYAYHWLPFYGILAALAALGFAAIEDWIRRSCATFGARSGTAAVATAIVFAVLLFPAIRLMSFSGFSTFVLGRRSPADHWLSFATADEGGYSAPVERTVSDYVRSHTEPADRVVIWGMEPLVHFLSGRAAATRFGYYYPLYAGEGTEFRARYRREFLEEIRDNEPVYVVIHELARDQNSLSRKPAVQHLREFPEFVAYIERHYRLERDIENFHLWRRRR